jgi:phosphoglycolate phosphatase
MKSCRLVVFDCDGTLADSQHSIVAAMSHAFERHDLPSPQPAAVRRVVGLSLEEAIVRLLEPREVALAPDLAAVYRAEAYRLRTGEGGIDPLYDGAGETLRALHAAGLHLGIATGKSMRGLRALLAGHGADCYFATLQTADMHPGKPDPSMLNAAMTEVGAVPAETILVGDTSYDMQMAQNAGVTAVGVTWGYHEVGDLKASGANEIVSNFGQLIEFLEI